VITRTFDLLEHIRQHYPHKETFVVKRAGVWEKINPAEYIKNANLVSLGLMALGITKGDRVATMIINNSPEWNYVDMGINQIGAIHLPLYPTLSDADLEYILLGSDVKLAFVANENLAIRIKPILSRRKDPPDIYAFEGHNGVRSWTEVIKLGNDQEEKRLQDLEEIKASIQPDDNTTLLFTSGTTGHPKGVMLSHNNLVSNILSASSRQPLGVRDRILSFLPLCHIYERTANYQFQYSGTTIYYAENFGTIPKNLFEIKADGMVTVPRFLEKMHEAFLRSGDELTGFRKKIFLWALDLGYQYSPDHKTTWWYRIRRSIAFLLVFRKWKNALGGRLRFIGCGGASIDLRLEQILWAAKLPVFQGFGLTETSPLITLNYRKGNNSMLGTVGPVIDSVEVKIASDGEILCRGPNVMKGYFLHGELSRDSIDNDGWFHTGDIGSFVNNKFLKIVGRKKDLFKTSYGKYVAPQYIEGQLRESRWIKQVMVLGEGEKFTAALIQPDLELIGQWVKSNNKTGTPESEKLIHLPEVRTMIQLEIDRFNRLLGNHEQIKKFQLVDDEWSIDTGEMTPTLKLKRDFILRKYRPLVDHIYEKSDTGRERL
jgi:long-chain acyl-CoA synthetase